MCCKICKTKLSGRQSKFCSNRCKNKHGNHKYQNYKAQKYRGTSRRAKLILLKGGCCSICKYNKNYAALAFHHIDSKLKELKLDLRSCSNNKWSKLLDEANKCILLCHNCHMEHHHPTMNRF